MLTKDPDINLTKSQLIRSIEKHKVDIAVLKDKENGLLSKISMFESLVPFAAVWCMWRLALASRASPASRPYIEEEARQKLSRLLASIEELKQGAAQVKSPPGWRNGKVSPGKFDSQDDHIGSSPYHYIEPSLKPGSHLLSAEPTDTKVETKPPIGAQEPRVKSFKTDPSDYLTPKSSSDAPNIKKEKLSPKNSSDFPNIKKEKLSPKNSSDFPNIKKEKLSPKETSNYPNSTNKEADGLIRVPLTRGPTNLTFPMADGTGEDESKPNDRLIRVPLTRGSRKHDREEESKQPNDGIVKVPLTRGSKKRDNNIPDMSEGTRGRSRVVREVIEIKRDGKPTEKIEIQPGMEEPQLKAVEDLIRRLDHERDNIQDEMDRIFGPLPEALAKTGDQLRGGPPPYKRDNSPKPGGTPREAPRGQKSPTQGKLPSSMHSGPNKMGPHSQVMPNRGQGGPRQTQPFSEGVPSRMDCGPNPMGPYSQGVPSGAQGGPRQMQPYSEGVPSRMQGGPNQMGPYSQGIPNKGPSNPNEFGPNSNQAPGPMYNQATPMSYVPPAQPGGLPPGYPTPQQPWAAPPYYPEGAPYGMDRTPPAQPTISPWGPTAPPSLPPSPYTQPPPDPISPEEVKSRLDTIEAMLDAITGKDDDSVKGKSRSKSSSPRKTTPNRQKSASHKQKPHENTPEISERLDMIEARLDNIAAEKDAMDRDSTASDEFSENFDEKLRKLQENINEGIDRVEKAIKKEVKRMQEI